MNGCLAEENVSSVAEILPWLQEAIAHFYPTSTYGRISAFFFFRTECLHPLFDRQAAQRRHRYGAVQPIRCFATPETPSPLTSIA